MNKNVRKFETSLLFLLKFALNLILFFVFYGMYGRTNWQLWNLSRTTGITIATYIVMSYMFANIYGRYDIGKRKNKPIIQSLMLSQIFTDVISVFVLSIMNTNKMNNLSFEFEQPWLLIPVLAIQFVVIWIFVCGGNALYFKIYEPENCVIITSSQQSLNEIARGVLKYRLQYKVNKVADYKDANLKKYIMENDTVFIYDVPVEHRTEILEYCYQNMKNVYFNPDMHDVIEKSAKHFILDDVSVYCNYSKGLTLEQRFVKRAMDIVISVIALILTSPIMLLTVILIRLDDHGSIIFKQNRATRDGKIFAVYKFRTMKENVENYSVVDNDDRVTRVGKILRKYRIDEIPQFFNVLKGDMSVVGPRPEMLANVFNYTSVLPEFEYRLRVKAGITGYAQIAGKYNTSPKDKLILDLTYIEEYSFWLDIKLLFQTLIVLFKKDSTEAFHKQEDMIFEEYEELDEK
ncbi:MAG: exopolysaccharide biosynthesis polyprenyl glycosylphosphotransferase [Wujia sp.]